MSLWAPCTTRRRSLSRSIYKLDVMGKSLIPDPLQVTDATPALLTYFGNSPNLGGAPFLPNGVIESRLNNYSSFDHQASHGQCRGPQPDAEL